MNYNSNIIDKFNKNDNNSNLIFIFKIFEFLNVSINLINIFSFFEKKGFKYISII